MALQGWISRAGATVGLQGWISRAGAKMALQGWISRAGATSDAAWGPQNSCEWSCAKS